MDADTGIGDPEPQFNDLVEAGPALDVDDDFPLRGEFDRVAGKIDQDLTEPSRIANQVIGHVGVDAKDELEALGMGPQREKAQRIFQKAPQIERFRIKLDLAGVDPREVEQVLDQNQEGIGRGPDNLEVLALDRAQGVSSVSAVSPMIAFIGVRISWLTLARNSPLTRAADSSGLLGTGQFGRPQLDATFQVCVQLPDCRVGLLLVGNVSGDLGDPDDPDR